jgi:prevent-host-death family protein
MSRISVKEARDHLRELIDRVLAGEEVILLRRGREVARILPPKGRRKKLPSLKRFRSSIRVRGKSMSAEVIKQRREERY